MPEPESTISDGSDDAEVESEIMQVSSAYVRNYPIDKFCNISTSTISEARDRLQVVRGDPAPGLAGGAGERRPQHGGRRRGRQAGPLPPTPDAQEGVQVPIW